MSTWPVGNIYTERSDARWRQLLAENWLKDMGTYEDGELTTDVLGLCFIWHSGLFDCTVLRVTRFGWLHLSLNSSRLLICSFAPPLLCVLCWPAPSFLLCHHASYLYSHTDIAYLRCHSYHWKVAWGIRSIPARTWDQPWHGELSVSSYWFTTNNPTWSLTIFSLVIRAVSISNHRELSWPISCLWSRTSWTSVNAGPVPKWRQAKGLQFGELRCREPDLRCSQVSTTMSLH